MTLEEAKQKAYPDGGGKYLIDGKWMKVHCDEYHMHSFKCLIEINSEQQLRPPLDIIISHLEGALDVHYENDEVVWSHVKRALKSAFDSYPIILSDTEETIKKLRELSETKPPTE